MTDRTRQSLATLMATAMTLSAVAGVAFVAGTGTVAASQHTPETAPTFNNSGGTVDFRINLPERTDHYPGNHPVHSGSNGHNASIEYFAAGSDAFRELGATEGIWMDFIEVGAPWIDYSECDVTQNTKVFGIDKGNNNEGTKIDQDLVEHRKGSVLGAGGLTITFFDWGDLSGDPPYLSPADAVVAAQGTGSNAGPCLKMTSDPGWYQLRGFTNGTIASECKEEGNSDCEPQTKERRGLNLFSNYVYICECDNEQQARSQLGPPPNEDDGSGSGSGGGDSGDATPTPTQQPATATPTSQPASTPTPTQQPATPTPTQASTRQQNGGDQQSGGNNQQSGGNNQRSGGNQQSGGQGSGQQGGGTGGQVDRGTPTIGEGPGFSAIAALVALLAAALVVGRRD